MAYSADFKTPICRFSYVQGMFTPTKRTDDAGKPMLDRNGNEIIKWGCTLIFPKATTDRSAFDNALKQVITEEWGEGGLLKAKNGLIRTPFLDGDGKEARNKKTGELHDGMGPDVWFIRVSTSREPMVRYRSMNVPATASEIKSGDWGHAAINAYTWHHEKNGDGVSFGIQFLQKTKDGESLGGGGGVNVEDYFEKIADAGDAPAATKTGAGAEGLFG
jgi:hypothetical protein